MTGAAAARARARAAKMEVVRAEEAALAEEAAVQFASPALTPGKALRARIAEEAEEARQVAMVRLDEALALRDGLRQQQEARRDVQRAYEWEEEEQRREDEERYAEERVQERVTARIRDEEMIKEMTNEAAARIAEEAKRDEEVRIEAAARLYRARLPMDEAARHAALAGSRMRAHELEIEERMLARTQMELRLQQQRERQWSPDRQRLGGGLHHVAASPSSFPSSFPSPIPSSSWESPWLSRRVSRSGLAHQA